MLGGILEHTQPLRRIGLFILRVVHSLLAVDHLNAGVPGLHAEVSNKDCSVQSNGHFPNSGDCRMPE